MFRDSSNSGGFPTESVLERLSFELLHRPESVNGNNVRIRCLDEAEISIFLAQL